MNYIMMNSTKRAKNIITALVITALIIIACELYILFKL